VRCSQRVFEWLVQAGQQLTRGHEEVGLGLAISGERRTESAAASPVESALLAVWHINARMRRLSIGALFRAQAGLMTAFHGASVKAPYHRHNAG